jgi:hypothetical protein
MFADSSLFQNDPSQQPLISAEIVSYLYFSLMFVIRNVLYLSSSKYFESWKFIEIYKFLTENVLFE